MAGRRVLVVEDQQAAAESLGFFLELAGFDVQIALTGPSGLALALDWLPDVVLCDIGLPGLDGWQLATQLRQSERIQHMRLIAITAYGSDEDRRHSQQAGFERHFTKPVDPTILLEVLGPAEREGPCHV
jgi:CheY-like chemotaxis protein